MERSHLAIQISDKTYGVPSTVNRHNPIAYAKGAVWFGKPDFGLPGQLVNLLNSQVDEGTTTYLFVIDPNLRNPVAYCAELLRVSLEAPPEKDLLPPFYKELKLFKRIKTWLKVSELEALRRDEIPGLDQANAMYMRLAKKLSLLGVKKLPEYFELIENQPS